jgi:uncharacterized protein (TIGR02145 family)
MKEVVIGLQVWLNKDLDTDCFANGDQIPQVFSSQEWIEANDKKQPAWCYYEFNEDNGKLYNSYAINDERGLAPKGWRIPTVSDFEQLLKTINNNLFAIMTNNEDYWEFGYDYSESGFWGDHYYTINFKEDYQFDEAGFNAIPNGYINNEGVFYSKLVRLENANVRKYVTDDKSDAFFYCRSSNGEAFEFCIYSGYQISDSYFYKIDSNFGYSIRCVSTNTDLTLEKIKSQIKYQPSYYLEVFEQYIDNEELLLYAIKYDAQYFKKSSQKQQQDIDFITEALKNNGMVMQYLQTDIKSNKEFASIAVQNNAEAYQFIDESLKNDFEIAKISVNENEWALDYLPLHFQINHEIALIALRKNRYNWYRLDENLINDSIFLLEAVKINGSILKFVEIDLLNHHEIIFNAIKQLSKVYLVFELYDFLNYKCPSIYEDESFILNVLNIEKICDSDIFFEYIPERFLNDREFIFKAISINGAIIKFASKDLLNDADFMKIVIEKNDSCYFDAFDIANLAIDYAIIFDVLDYSDGELYDCFPDSLKYNQDVLWMILNQNTFYMEPYNIKKIYNNLDLALKNKIEIPSVFKTMHPFLLAALPEKSKDNDELVRIACVFDNSLLEFASDRLKNDREFILDIFQKSKGFQSLWRGHCLDYASDEIQNDITFIKKLIEIHGTVSDDEPLQFLSENIKKKLKEYDDEVEDEDDSWIEDSWSNDEYEDE